MSAISGTSGMGYCYNSIKRTSAKAETEAIEDENGEDPSAIDTKDENGSSTDVAPDEGTDPDTGINDGDEGSEVDPGEDVDPDAGVDPGEDVDPDKGVDPGEDIDTDKDTDNGNSGTTSLAEFKRQFLAKIQTTLNNPRLAHLNLDLNITDAAYTKMMNDSNYEKTVLELFNRKASISNLAMAGTISIVADGTLENTYVDKAEDFGMARRLFGNSPRSIVRSASLDSLVELAYETISYREKYLGKFETASSLASITMKSSTSYLNDYMKKAGLLDTTG